MVTAVNSTAFLIHHCAHMNNNPPSFGHTWNSFLQQQLESSSNALIIHLLQSQFHDYLTQTVLSLQSYTSQQIEILHLIPTPPLTSYPTTFTPQPQPPIHTPQPNGFAIRQILRCPPWTHLQHHLYDLGRVQTPRSPILRRRIQVFLDLHRRPSLPLRQRAPTHRLPSNMTTTSMKIYDIQPSCGTKHLN